MVDTGATFTVIPANILEELGVSRAEQETFTLADGSARGLSIGYATMELQDHTAPVNR